MVNLIKKEYRKYKIKTVEGPDDYASMREVIRRRYSRVKRDGLTPPDLIIMDGGQGQVNVAKDVLRNELNLSIPVAGLQKNDKHQTNEFAFLEILCESLICHVNPRNFSSFTVFRMKYTALPSPSIVKSVVRIVSVLNLMAWRG